MVGHCWHKILQGGLSLPVCRLLYTHDYKKKTREPKSPCLDHTSMNDHRSFEEFNHFVTVIDLGLLDGSSLGIHKQPNAELWEEIQAS